MNTTTNSYHPSSFSTNNAQDNISLIDTTALSELLKEELILQLGSLPSSAVTVISRIVAEVERICTKSDRIQQGGEVRSSQLSLARHRLSKCVEYYNPLLSPWENSTNLRRFSPRKIKVSPHFDKRGITWSGVGGSNLSSRNR